MSERFTYPGKEYIRGERPHQHPYPELSDHYGAVRSALGNPSWLWSVLFYERIDDDAAGQPRYAVCYKIDPQQLPDDLEDRIAAAAPIVDGWLGICLAI